MRYNIIPGIIMILLFTINSNSVSQKEYSVVLPCFYKQDLNCDGIVNLKDAALFFIYHTDSLEALPEDIILDLLDFNTDRVINELDIEGFFGGLFSIYIYNPVLTHPDSLSYMSDTVKENARNIIFWIEQEHPEWRYKTVGIKRQLGLTDQPPVEMSYDLNDNGQIEKNDIIIFFIYLSDSVGVLAEDNIVLKRIDYNADGQVNFLDAEAYLYPILEEEIYYSAFPLILVDPLLKPMMTDEAIMLASRIFAWLEDGFFRYKSYLNVPRIERPEVWRIFPVNPLYREGILYLSPPIPTPGDLNYDFMRRTDDAVIFFSYFSDSLGVLPDTNDMIQQMDLNFDGRVDTLDIENFFFFLFYKLVLQEVSLDSLPPLSGKARNLALTWLEKMKPLHPEWRCIGPSRNLDNIQHLYDYIFAVQVSCDMNADGRVDIADAIALLILGRNNDLSADWNGNGAFGIDDVISFLLDVRAGKCN